MTTPLKPSLLNRTTRQCGATGIVILAATSLVLAAMGRHFWCECGGLEPFSWDIWSQHNSQHLIDPYSFTHVLHGILFYALLGWLWKSLSIEYRFSVAILLESSWEILENTPMVIERYRSVTISLDYYGDSIANSIMDVIACAIGFAIACRFRPRVSVAVFVATELILLITIRDCLTLNVVMLLWPLEAIKTWQMGLR